MNKELIPQVVIRLSIARRGAVDEIVAKWVSETNRPVREDIQNLWANHFASVADYWQHKAKHPGGHAGAMVILYEWAKMMGVTV